MKSFKNVIFHQSWNWLLDDTNCDVDTYTKTLVPLSTNVQETHGDCMTSHVGVQ